jgi:hypothetical protein
MVVPLYIGEVVPPRVRGALVSFNQLAITPGILTSYLVDYGLASRASMRLYLRLRSQRFSSLPGGSCGHMP